VQAQVVALLKRLQQEKQIAYLFITHDLMLAHTMCDRIAVMYRGEIVECGTADQIIKSPMHPYTKLLLSCVLKLKVSPDFSFVDCASLREPAPDGCKFYEYCPNAAPQCSQAAPKLQTEEGRKVACFQLQK
jgi:peptide/nickel transport system ATP-binding protein